MLLELTPYCRLNKMDPKDELSEMEMEAVTTVFRQYETGLREAAINARVFI